MQGHSLMNADQPLDVHGRKESEANAERSRELSTHCSCILHERIWVCSGAVRLRAGAQLTLRRRAGETCKAGYTRFDVYTPFPVHGMDQAMGLGREAGLDHRRRGAGRVPHRGGPAVLRCLGLSADHQGKPFYAWQPYTIVCFELTVLFASFAAVLGMFFLNGLPHWYHPTLKPMSFAKATDNGFFLTIESARWEV